MKWWTCSASLLLAIAACENAPTAPLAPQISAVAVPGGGPMSTQGPMPGNMSASSPQAGPMSVESPQRMSGGREAAPNSSIATVPGWTANARPFEAIRNSTVAIVTPAMRLLWQNTSTGERSIWLMNGTAWDGGYALLPSVATAWSMAASSDFNNDGNSDIVWQNTTTGDRSIWFMNNTTWDGTYALLPSVAVAWSIAGAGDFNNDGKPDLVWQNTTTGDRSIWFMNGSTWDGTSYALLPSVDPNWRIAAVADFNADSKPDLVWQNITTGQRSIWFMDGSTWAGGYALLPSVATDWSIAGAADFDGDYKPDLVWQNLTTGQRSLWLMNGPAWDGAYALLPTISTAWSIAGTLAPPASLAARIALTPYPAIVDMGSTLPTAVTAYDGGGAPVSPPALTYTSRNTGIATVGSDGVVTGVARGQTILVAAATSTPSIADSVVVVVTAVGGPALYTDINKFGYAVNGNFTVKVFLDMRGSGKTLGSSLVTATWNTSAMAWQGWSASGPSVSPEVNLSNTSTGTFVFDMANAAGIAGKVELLQFTLKAGATIGATGALTLSTSETNAGDLTVMTSQTTGITNPIKLQ